MAKTKIYAGRSEIYGYEIGTDLKSFDKENGFDDGVYFCEELWESWCKIILEVGEVVEITDVIIKTKKVRK